MLLKKNKIRNWICNEAEHVWLFFRFRAQALKGTPYAIRTVYSSKDYVQRKLAIFNEISISYLRMRHTCYECPVSIGRGTPTETNQIERIQLNCLFVCRTKIDGYFSIARAINNNVFTDPAISIAYLTLSGWDIPNDHNLSTFVNVLKMIRLSTTKTIYNDPCA